LRRTVNNNFCATYKLQLGQARFLPEKPSQRQAKKTGFLRFFWRTRPWKLGQALPGWIDLDSILRRGLNLFVSRGGFYSIVNCV
jgi:hypothetical protein